ncbi:hypothetical protein [Pelomonas sp. KK5]|uniref:hypothetical protein n=1 Tax=Pelomonas sp. KK5 TaxID=1855730 RepID=UPI00097C1F1F|nr:hypothetical protein [Pelomonas sp. KK5]
MRVFEDKRYDYDPLGRLVLKRSGRHTEQRFEWNAEHQLVAVHSERNGVRQAVSFSYDALGRRIEKRNGSFGATQFVWDGLRLLQELQGSRVTTLVYESAHSCGSAGRTHRRGRPRDLARTLQNLGQPGLAGTTPSAG